MESRNYEQRMSKWPSMLAAQTQLRYYANPFGWQISKWGHWGAQGTQSQVSAACIYNFPMVFSSKWQTQTDQENVFHRMKLRAHLREGTISCAPWFQGGTCAEHGEESPRRRSQEPINVYMSPYIQGSIDRAREPRVNSVYIAAVKIIALPINHRYQISRFTLFSGRNSGNRVESIRGSGKR